MVPILFTVCLFVGALAGDASATAPDAPLIDRRQDQKGTTVDLLQKYSTQVKQLHSHVSNADKCYTEYLEKIRREGADINGIDACDKDYDAAVSLLGEAHKTVEEPGFPGNNELYRLKLPDVRDGRAEFQGIWTQELQEGLGQMSETSKLAFKAMTQAELLPKYHDQMTELMNSVSNASKCYDDYANEIKQEGLVSDSMDACDKQYDTIQSVLLPQARATASDPNFPGDNWLFAAKLPDVRIGKDQHQDTWTKELQTKLEQLSQVAEKGFDADKTEGRELQQLNSTLWQEIVPAVNKTIVEMAYNLVQFIGLRHVLKENGTAETALKLTKASLDKFLAEVGQFDEEVNKTLLDYYHDTSTSAVPV